MALKMPSSMEECVYFTRRVMDKGKVVAWVLKAPCPKCKKGLMSKPVEKGKVKVRAAEYMCSECNHAVPKQAYEDTLTCNVAYTCPHCQKVGEVQIPFMRKTFQGVKALVFECQSCKEKIPITKKMKAPKKSKDSAGFDED